LHRSGLRRVVKYAWIATSLFVLVGFIGVLLLLANLLPGDDVPVAPLVATGVIAVAFDPVRRRVQRRVGRMLYGERDDPYGVLARLGDTIARTLDPDDTLPLLAETLGRSLKLPYVAVELDRRDGPRLAAEHGRPVGSVEAFHMDIHGRRVGRLLVAPRVPGDRFTARERGLLTDTALQAAAAAERISLIRDLQDSRERVVMAREEERRRLRRDLHDGLGPTFAGLSMQLRAARKYLAPGRAVEILDGMAADLMTVQSEVRRLVDQLRPVALDKGLAAALREECRRFHSTGLSVDLGVNGSLDGLPAPVEEAAYRVVAEALTNVVRHSGTRDCRVTVSRTAWLEIEITDDGVGIDGPPTRSGVGLASMRERVEELGGVFAIGAAEPSGTTIRARLPSGFRSGGHRAVTRGEAAARG
jgi:two-component system, NarL family, sensor kinase